MAVNFIRIFVNRARINVSLNRMNVNYFRILVRKARINVNLESDKVKQIRKKVKVKRKRVNIIIVSNNPPILTYKKTHYETMNYKHIAKRRSANNIFAKSLYNITKHHQHQIFIKPQHNPIPPKLESAYS